MVPGAGAGCPVPLLARTAELRGPVYHLPRPLQFCLPFVVKPTELSSSVGLNRTLVPCLMPDTCTFQGAGIRQEDKILAARVLRIQQ